MMVLYCIDEMIELTAHKRNKDRVFEEFFPLSLVGQASSGIDVFLVWKKFPPFYDECPNQR